MEEKVAGTHKRCPVCRTNGYKTKPLEVGTCKACKAVLKDDYELLFQAAEGVAQAYGYTMTNVFENTRKAEAVSARRLITTAVLSLSGATSEDVARMMRLRGRNITATSLRHALLVARDLYSVSKNYRMLVDKFMTDTLNQYMMSEGRMRSLTDNRIDIIGNVLFTENVCSRERATELAMRIAAALSNTEAKAGLENHSMQGNQQETRQNDEKDDSSPSDMDGANDHE